MHEIFISYKKTDDDGGLTIDFECAKEVERILENHGCDVFFSERSLIEEGRSNYKRAIDEALDDAKVLIVVTSSIKNVDSRWVRYEWESFYNDYLSGKREKPNLFTVTKGDVVVSELPRTLRSLQCFDFDKEMDKLVETVLSIVNKTDKQPKKYIPPVKEEVSPCNFYLIKPEEITDEDIQECLDMEAEIYKEDECQDFDLCQKIHQLNPYTDLFFKDVRTGKIVGNIDICPVTDECYELMRSGEFMDSEITIDMVVPYDMPSLYNIYFTGIAVREEYRNTGLFLFMFDAALQTFLKLGERGILAKRMIADAVTENGERFCKMFGMKKVRDSEHGSKLYEVSFMPPEFRVTSRQTKALFEYYKAKYEEMKDYID